MPMLDATDVADLTAIFTNAQTDFSLVLYRYSDGLADWVAVAAQDVQVDYNSTGRQPAAGNMPGANTLRIPITFYREAPFDVLVGDAFAYGGHKGGKVTGVFTDPVLGVIGAEATLDEGR